MYHSIGYVAVYSFKAIEEAVTTDRNGTPLFSSDGEIGDYFGNSITLNNDNIACISAPYHKVVGNCYCSIIIPY